MVFLECFVAHERMICVPSIQTQSRRSEGRDSTPTETFSFPLLPHHEEPSRKKSTQNLGKLRLVVFSFTLLTNFFLFEVRVRYMVSKFGLGDSSQGKKKKKRGKKEIKIEKRFQDSSRPRLNQFLSFFFFKTFFGQHQFLRFLRVLESISLEHGQERWALLNSYNIRGRLSIVNQLPEIKYFVTQAALIFILTFNYGLDLSQSPHQRFVMFNFSRVLFLRKSYFVFR